MIFIDKGNASSKGFSLIELMITIAIVAILVAMAVPAYKDYSIRAKIGECINGAAVAKFSISEYRQSLGAWPSSLIEAGLSDAGTSKYCSGLKKYNKETGAFTIDINEDTIDSLLGGKVLEPILTPNRAPSGMIVWTCMRSIETSPENAKYLPATCRST